MAGASDPRAASRRSAEPEAPATVDEPLPDRLLDEVLPERLEWRRLVRRYPKTSLMIALAGGYYLGRRRGWEILEALAGFAADTATESVNHAVGRDLL